VSVASLALFVQTTESNAAYFIDPRCRRSVAKPANPPQRRHLSPSP
jgi:hypothetical protein